MRLDVVGGFVPIASFTIYMNFTPLYHSPSIFHFLLLPPAVTFTKVVEGVLGLSLFNSIKIIFLAPLLDFAPIGVGNRTYSCQDNGSLLAVSLHSHWTSLRLYQFYLTAMHTRLKETALDFGIMLSPLEINAILLEWMRASHWRCKFQMQEAETFQHFNHRAICLRICHPGAFIDCSFKPSEY